MSYVCDDHASALAARLLTRRVSQALFAAAPMYLLLIFFALATERESGNTRLGLSKIIQPSVDLIHMAAYAQYHQQTGDYLFYL